MKYSSPKITVFKFAILFSLIVTQPGCNENIASNTSNDLLIQKLDSTGLAILDDNEVVGFSVAIMQGSDTVYNRGFGSTDIQGRNPVTNDTRFLMASVSKLVGATLTLKLVEELRLSLDQTLDELLPNFPNPEQAKLITLEQSDQPYLWIG